MRISFLTIHLFLTLVLASNVIAQTHLGSILGTITDPSGATVANATVLVTHEGTSLTRTIVTGPSGRFSVSQLTPGIYRVEIEIVGYKTYVNFVRLEVNQHRRIDAALEIGAITEQILVRASDTPLRSDSTELGTIVDNNQITELPLDDRNFLELVLLAPGAYPNAEGSAGSVRGDFTFSVNGAREDMNDFLLDGTYNVDPKLNTAGVRPPVDGIEEFQVLASSYDASFGRHAGAHINVITKSGSNLFKGTGYEFFRHRAMNARNAFAPRGEKDPTYKRNQFGFSFGGPLIQNRTFFFLDYERTRLSEGITRVTNVPTLEERTGNFSQSLLPTPQNPYTRQPFTNGIIPAAYLNPIGVAIADLYPKPNRNVPLENFVSSPALRDRKDHFDVRLDHTLGVNSLLTTRYSFNDRRLFEPFSGSGFTAIPGFGTNVSRRAQNLMVSETSVISSKLVNDVRLTFSRVSMGVFHENTGSSLNRSVGLPEMSGNPIDWGLSFMTLTGLSPLGDEYNNPQKSTTNTFQILDTLTYANGNHLLKFGFDVRITNQDAFRNVQSRGFLMFSSVPFATGNALADLLLGFPVISGVATIDNPQHLRTRSYDVFVHDNFQVTRNLTVSAGIRYEYHSPPVDANNLANIYVPATQSLVRVGTNGIPRAGYNSDNNNFAPRIGLAWSPRANGQTVLRGGYGIYYNQSALAVGEGLYFNPPFYKINMFFPLQANPIMLSNPFPFERFASIPLPSSALTFQRDLRTPYLQQWNVTLEQQLGTNRAIEVSYVGSKGNNLLGGRDINQAKPTSESLLSPSPFERNIRPDPKFLDITSLESRGTSLYNSLQVKIRQRFSSGFSFLSSYTLGKSTDDVSNFFGSTGDPNFPQDSNNPKAERGRSNFDIRHRFSLSFSYDLPFGAGRHTPSDRSLITRLIEGWTIAGLVTLQSGRPFTVSLLPDIDNSNTGRAALGFGNNDRPNLVGDQKIDNPSTTRWFNTDAFTMPPFGHFGSSGRNILDGPAFKNVNVVLLKQVPLRENATLQLRLEAFNLFNHVNFNLPDLFFNSPTFGRISSAGDQRRLQFGIKCFF